MDKKIEENFEKWINFLNPDNLKDNLIFCSLYISFYETTKDYVVSQLESFFSIGYNSVDGDIISPDYKEKVLALDSKKNPMNASLIWFRNEGAIDENDIHELSEIRKSRNLLAHEMLEHLFEGINKDFAEKFAKLIEIRVKIERWWVWNIEIPTSDNEYPDDLKEEDVMTSSQITYQLIMDIVSGDAEKSKYYYNEFLKVKEKGL
ncbi:MAG: hypothetical protein V4622_09860 [Bacteroidota bacterium]